MSDTRDAYDLSDEEYQKALNNPESLFEQDEEEQEENLGYDPNTEDLDDQDQENQDEQDQNQDKGDTGFQGTDFAKAPDQQKITLIHNGQTIEVSQQEAVNLAQKGYDYEKKTAQIAPHRRLIELVEGDEELQEIINRHVVRRTMPKTSKREDFDTEDEWFQDNMERIMAKTTPVVSKAEPDVTQQSQAQATPTGQGGESPVVRALRNRDPQHFEAVKPHLVQAIQGLKVEDYQRITQSAAEVVKFYDQVKSQVVGTQTGRSAARKPGQKSFNLRGGGGPPRTPAKKNVWELSNKDFNTQLRKAKGY
jgi:hypothetical protein